MKVLFVATGNSFSYYRGNYSPHVKGPGDALIQNGVDLEVFQIVGRGIRGYLSAIPKLRRFLRDNKFDIIHAHYGNCGIVAALSRSSEKLVVSYMGSDLLGSINSKGQYTLMGNAFVQVNKLCAFFINDYSIVKASIMKNRLWKKNNIEVLPNGVNFDDFFPMSMQEARRRLNISPGKKIVLFVSDPCIIIKNFKLAENAIKRFNNNIEFKILSGMSQTELNVYYNAADLTLLTSIHEGSPNVIKEAMACNCPIVSTDVGDVKEVIGDTEGCYITSYDPDDVAHKINQAILFNKRTNGRESIKHLDSNKLAKKMINLYREILK